MKGEHEHQRQPRRGTLDLVPVGRVTFLTPMSSALSVKMQPMPIPDVKDFFLLNIT